MVILVKDERALELVKTVNTVVFDKTGTLTQEQPHVGAIHPTNGYTPTEVLTFAAAAEYKQTHPIARAILQEAHDQHLVIPAINDAAYEVGYGLKVWLNGTQVRVGSGRFLQNEAITIPPAIQAVQQQCHDQGSRWSISPSMITWPALSNSTPPLARKHGGLSVA